ncbi:MAG: thiamine pyrophosphate-dependent enzyme, partial [Candidatus Micrarchaeota archaeon]
FAPGHAGCPGCGPSTTMIQVLDALGKDTIVVNATGCMEITSSLYPQSAWRVPYIHSLFENAPAVASGVVNALRAKGNDHTKVVVIAGDGSTYDIGFGALSGMLDRGEDVLYILYDNELYANTGVQKSGATPLGAATTTTPVGSLHRGKETPRKPIVEIAAAHGIPYAASASIGFINDLQAKLTTAAAMRGSRFIAIHAPCCLGAGFDGSITMNVAKLAVQTRLWQLYEIEGGKLTINMKIASPKPVGEYLKLQKRFSHLTLEETAKIQEFADENWKLLTTREARQSGRASDASGI